MIDVITNANMSLYQKEITDMFQMRHRVAIGELGWNLPGAKAGYDVDEFDTASTIYFISRDEDGKVRACARLNPTVRPHLMSEHFADCCTLSPVPQHRNTYELSRYLVESKGRPRREFLNNRTRIIVALNEFCVANSISNLTWFTYKKRYAEACTFWETEPLGPSKYFVEDNAEYIPAMSLMNETGLAAARVWAKSQEPQIAGILMPLEHTNLQLSEQSF